MENFRLSAQKRNVFGKQNKKLRQQNLLPAILYGQNLESMPLTIKARDFALVYKEAGDSSLINLEVVDDQKKTTHSVLVQEINYDPKSLKPIHIDFYAVKMDKPITTHVPLVFIGESPAVKQGGILVKVMQELEIEALPENLPHQIEVDISSLDHFEATYYARDLKIPPGVKILTDLNSPVATVTVPRSEEELKGLEEKVEEKVEEIKIEGEEKRAAETIEQSQEEKT